jgi:hypothetical protein
MSHAAYLELSAYLDDLKSRVEAQKAWRRRHPDAGTPTYEDDVDAYIDSPTSWTPGRSTFDPSDPMPQTSDLFTADRFITLMTVAVTAYEKAGDRAR